MSNTYHSNKQIKWNSITGHAYHDSGKQAFNSVTGHAYHDNGKPAFNSVTKKFYDKVGHLVSNASFSFSLGKGIAMLIIPNIKITVYGRKVNK
jgi:hypothetical protein